MFIGVDGIIVNQKNACGLTSTVSKVSSGALEFIPLYSVRFVSKFMEDAQAGLHNFKIISTDIQSSNEGGEISPPPKEPEIHPDSDDDKEIAEMLGMKHESRFLKDLKKENSKQQESEPEEEPGVDEEPDDQRPYKANQVISIDELKLKRDENIILVLGSEGEGVSRTINRIADYRVMIPP